MELMRTNYIDKILIGLKDFGVNPIFEILKRDVTSGCSVHKSDIMVLKYGTYEREII
jgi:hypothetical protein